jgi:hypothetical protein
MLLELRVRLSEEHQNRVQRVTIDMLLLEQLLTGYIFGKLSIVVQGTPLLVIINE